MTDEREETQTTNEREEAEKKYKRVEI